MVSQVGKVPVYCAGDSGLVPGGISNKGLKNMEKKVLPLLCIWKKFIGRLSHLFG